MVLRGSELIPFQPVVLPEKGRWATPRGSENLAGAVVPIFSACHVKAGSEHTQISHQHWSIISRERREVIPSSGDGR